MKILIKLHFKCFHDCSIFSICKKFFIQFIFIVFNKTLYQRTALHVAVESGNIELVKILLMQKSIDVNAKTEVLNVFFNQVLTKSFMVKLQLN